MLHQIIEHRQNRGEIFRVRGGVVINGLHGKIRGIPEHPAGGRARKDHPALRVYQGDPVVGVLDQGAEIAPALQVNIRGASASSPIRGRMSSPVCAALHFCFHSIREYSPDLPDRTTDPAMRTRS